MAADNPHSVESAGTEPAGDAYLSPMADFLLVSLFISIVAVAVVAVMIP